MDIEQLKLVLETLQGLGHETSTLAMIWLSLTYGTEVLGWLIAAGVITYVCRLFYSACTTESQEQFFKEMRDHLGTGTSGPLTNRELRDTKNAIRVLVAEKNARTHGDS